MLVLPGGTLPSGLVPSRPWGILTFTLVQTNSQTVTSWSRPCSDHTQGNLECYIIRYCIYYSLESFQHLYSAARSRWRDRGPGGGGDRSEGEGWEVTSILFSRRGVSSSSHTEDQEWGTAGRGPDDVEVIFFCYNLSRIENILRSPVPGYNKQLYSERSSPVERERHRSPSAGGANNGRVDWKAKYLKWNIVILWSYWYRPQ